MYTIKEVVGDKFKLTSEFDLINVEGIKTVTVRTVDGKSKQVIVGIGLYDYLFNTTFKKLVKDKTKKDLGEDFHFVYGVNFS